jgi:ATP-dependent RNA helicase DHX37/DHR1
MIGITQPRRVAALSTASRVSQELNLPPPIIAHQVRYAKTTSPETRIKFMTDGVLLRELTGDLMLSRYSVVIVDEAHERGVNTDVLIGVLSRVVKLREKLWREGKEGVKVCLSARVT